MSELSDALRRFADALDKGQPMKDATMATVVLCNAEGGVNATYIGHLVPARDAGIKMCAAGIDRFISAEMMKPSTSVTRGSTH